MRKNNNQPDSQIVKDLAALFGYTKQYVGMCINGKRHNKAITDAYNFMVEEKEKAKSKLSKKVAKMSAKPKKQAA